MDNEVALVIAKIEAANEKRHSENKELLESIQRSVEKALSGFPGGDPESHRRYHESVIEWRELRNKLVKEALTKAAGAVGVGVLGWLAWGVWQAIITTLKAKVGA